MRAKIRIIVVAGVGGYARRYPPLLCTAVVGDVLAAVVGVFTNNYQRGIEKGSAMYNLLGENTNKGGVIFGEENPTRAS